MRNALHHFLRILQNIGRQAMRQLSHSQLSQHRAQHLH